MELGVGMTPLDILLLAALAVFVVVWWVRATPARPYVLLGAALVALAAAVAGMLDYRWQAFFGAVMAGVFLVALLIGRLRKTNRTDGVPFITGAIFAALAIGAGAFIYLFPVNALPKPSGEHVVGVRTFELSDPTRKGVWLAGADEPRRLLIRVWYPAQSANGAPRPYFDDREAETTGRSMGSISNFPLLFTYLKHVRTNSYENAPLLSGAQSLPVIFYSHGYTSFLAQNTVLMEDLASHGYIVFSVQHPYDSSATVFPNGDVAPMDPGLFEQMGGNAGPPPENDPLRQALAGTTLDARFDGYLRNGEQGIEKQQRIVRSGPIWVADRIFVHDALQRGQAPAEVSDIVAAGNLARVGEVGMSFGGSTTGGLCMVDPRCTAGINLDGADYHFAPFDADMPKPFLMFHSDMNYIYQGFGVDPGPHPRPFNIFSYESFEHAGQVADVYRVTMRGARHLGISDFSLFTRRPVRDVLFGYGPADVMTGAQNTFVRGFFDRYLREQQNDFPRAQLTQYQGWVSAIDNSEVRTWWEAKTPEERAAIEARIAALKAHTTPSAPQPDTAD